MASRETSRDTQAHGPGGRGAGKATADSAAAGSGEDAKQPDHPDWSHGLRQLYDSVVEEELPDSFRALLDKLDDTDPEEIDGSGHTHDTAPSTGGGTPSPKGGGA
ncbi:MAG: hypothetical protein GVX90_05655 [Alphaproteobacteria bacterium]|jgi:hypothetical protein|nr:hypothetical protein [Alphaproteobacteria bacterium]